MKKKDFRPYFFDIDKIVMTLIIAKSFSEVSIFIIHLLGSSDKSFFILNIISSFSFLRDNEDIFLSFKLAEIPIFTDLCETEYPKRRIKNNFC